MGPKEQYKHILQDYFFYFIFFSIYDNVRVLIAELSLSNHSTNLRSLWLLCLLHLNKQMPKDCHHQKWLNKSKKIKENITTFNFGGLDWTEYVSKVKQHYIFSHFSIFFFYVELMDSGKIFLNSFLEDSLPFDFMNTSFRI